MSGFRSVLFTSLLVLRTTAATLSLPADKCDLINREPISPSPQIGDFGCGKCLSGYQEDKVGRCVLSSMSRESSAVQCPSNKKCLEQGRRPCDLYSLGKCGSCLSYYLDVDGICVTEAEIKALLREVQAFQAENFPSSQAKEVSQDIPIEPRTDDIQGEDISGIYAGAFLDKKAQSQIFGGAASRVMTGASVTIPQPPTFSSTKDVHGASTETPSAHPSELIAPAIKRVPEISSKPNLVEVSAAEDGHSKFSQLIFFVVVLSVSLVCVSTLIIAGVCWYRVYKQRKLTDAADYLGWGGEKPKVVMPKSNSGDRKLAHSAQMYHYQHHKQQIMALEKSLSDKIDNTDDDDDDEEPEENENGDYTVYECPGLAPAGEMEVQNPLFVASNNKANPATSSQEVPVPK